MLQKLISLFLAFVLFVSIFAFLCLFDSYCIFIFYMFMLCSWCATELAKNETNIYI